MNPAARATLCYVTGADQYCGGMTATRAYVSLGNEDFISLTTFRKTGVGVSTPVWIARDGDALIVTTPDDAGKVKRVRNNARVEMRPCTRMGKVADDAVAVTGYAQIIGGAAGMAPLERVFTKKYRVEYYVFMLIERVVARRQKPRVILRITPTKAA